MFTLRRSRPIDPGVAVHPGPAPLFPAMFGGIAVNTNAGAIFEEPPSPVSSFQALPTARPADRVSVFDFASPDRTGKTDCSDSIRTAHDAAVEQGYRYLWFPPGDYFAPTLASCGNAIFVGPGRLLGAFRKHIIPEHLPPRPLQSDVVPLTHLPHFLEAVATATPNRPAVVIGMGDSTTWSGSPIGRAETMTDHIQRRLSETFSGAEKTIRYLNYGIGGLSWEQAAAPVMDASVRAPWITSRDLSWIGHVIAAHPDLVILNFGQNGGSSFDCRHLRSVYDALKAASAVRLQNGERPIDILFLTPFPASTMPGPKNDAAVLRARLDGIDWIAGYIRSFCRMYNVGLIDVHRAGCLARDGFDIATQAMIRTLTDAREQNFPYAASTPANDFEIQFSLDGESGRAFWNNGALHVSLSSREGNDLVLDRNEATGTLAVTVFAATGVVSRPRVVTSTPAHFKVDKIIFTIYAKGSRLFVDRASSVILDAPVERHGGQFTPTISFASGAVVGGVTINYLNMNLPTLSMPVLTNAEMFGVPNGKEHSAKTIEPGGGNGINHLSSIGSLMVLGAAMDATRFA